MRSGNVSPRVSVTLISTLPPITSHSPYGSKLLGALCHREDTDIEFLGFRRLYPQWLYPGGPVIDPAARRPDFPEATIRDVLTWYNPLGWFWAGLTIRGDVVHAQWWSYVVAPIYAVILSLARLRRKRVVVTMHNVVPHEQSLWARALNRFILSLANHVIVHTESCRASLMNSFGQHPDRVSVIRHGILGATSLRGLTRESAKDELGISRDRNVLLLFGNLRPYKGLKVLLEALSQIRQKEPDVLLVIAGKPWTEVNEYEEMTGRLGLGDHVQMHVDYVPESQIEAYFMASDLVVFPYTHFDAQSGVGTLALPFGRAMIVSDVGGLPELVKDSRVVVRPEDPDALARAILDVLRNPELKRTLEEQSLAEAKSYNWDGIAQQTVAVYLDMLSGHL